MVNAYIYQSIFLTPFCDKFLTVYIVSSLYFIIELILVTNYFDSDGLSHFIYIPMWLTLMFLQTYFVRYILTSFFVMQCEAEKTSSALTQVLENLPSAVLMLEEEKLSYCN